jgi:hypothetical protein
MNRAYGELLLIDEKLARANDEKKRILLRISELKDERKKRLLFMYEFMESKNIAEYKGVKLDDIKDTLFPERKKRLTKKDKEVIYENRVEFCRNAGIANSDEFMRRLEGVGLDNLESSSISGKQTDEFD